MPELPSPQEAPTGAAGEYAYDFEQASRILQAMDFLRKEAVKTRIPEIINMIDSSFQLMLTTYYCILRFEMSRLPAADDEAR